MSLLLSIMIYIAIIEEVPYFNAEKPGWIRATQPR